MVNVGSLRWIENVWLVRSAVAVLLEESLSHTFIDDDECDLRKSFSFRLGVVFISKDLLQLVELELNDLLAHRITNTITIDEDVVWESAGVVVSVSLESRSKIILKDV